MIIENENTFLANFRTGFNLFLGAGFSTLATDRRGRPLPVGAQLRSEIMQTFNLHPNLELAPMAKILNVTKEAEFRSFLTDRFTVSDFDERYKIIEKLPIKSIFTTNIDNLLHEIYKNGTKSYLNDLDIRGAVFSDRDATDLVALHGCVLDNSRQFAFNPTELASAFARESDRWFFLADALAKTPTLFIGYSLSDSGTLNVLDPSTTSSTAAADRWITVLPGTESGDIEYYRAMGFQIVECDVSELLDYFIFHYDAEQDGPSPSLVQTLPLDWTIPDPAEVFVRPISDYFRGAPPTWYDVYSGQLATTKYHAQVRDALNSNLHTFIVGIPGSGKSTLMMQVLRDFPYDGHKIVTDPPTPQKAELIVNRLAGEPALIGIDNVSDDLDGMAVLAKQPNVRILACDEIYWLETVSHRLPGNRMRIVDVTDLSDEDTQNIIARIPPDLRRHTRYQQPQASGAPPSIFDIVEYNTRFPTLAQRYRDVLPAIDKKNPLLLDFLLVCAYVHSCRTPISLDMLLAFYRGTNLSYQDVFKMRDDLRGLVSSYEGDFDDGTQDYYSPRSSLISRAIINQARSSQLRRVIERFHNQVSSFRIVRYDIFKKRAFAHELMQRAFGDWNDGIEFYRNAYQKEQNPYVLQQGSLYLANKSRFNEAFQMIDAALSASNHRIPAIRNSHAVILFNANIKQPETDGTVEKTLQESMEILMECYEYDRRKAYHAQKLAEHALQYEKRFGFDKTEPYLKTALAWLNQEAGRRPWLREVSRLRRAVSVSIGVGK